MKPTPPRVRVTKRRDLLMVEKFDEQRQRLERGSHLFCGVCGGSVGQLRTHYPLPVYPHALLSKLRHRSVDWSVVGLYHRTCGHSLFCFRPTFDLMSLTNYRRQFALPDEEVLV